MKWEYAPAGLSDLVAYFVRRIYSILRPGGFTAFITTNSIKDGDIRKDGLEQVLAQGGTINMAVRGIKWPGRANLIVSLVSLYSGKWTHKRMLDGKEVSIINSFFEDEMDDGAPTVLFDNKDRLFVGTHFLGDGFLLSNHQTSQLIENDERNKEVIFPIMNGQELNNRPDQLTDRNIIYFFDWSIEKAKKYSGPFQIVEEKVKPERSTQKEKRLRDKWWIFKRPFIEIYNRNKKLTHCFAAAITTKHLNFSALPNNYVFTHAIYVLTTDRWDLYSIVQSTIHEIWARKHSGALGATLRYSPTDCFGCFPFPQGLWQIANPALAEGGELYHEYRRALMLRLWLGLTDIYNLFHNCDLTPAIIAKVSKKPDEAEAGYQGILELRKLHRELDQAVLAAYGWTDLDLGHDFVEVETLPENDRVRYTISPEARKEVLKKLLALNHQRAEEEKNTFVVKESSAKYGKKGRRKKVDEEPGLFG